MKRVLMVLVVLLLALGAVMVIRTMSVAEAEVQAEDDAPPPGATSQMVAAHLSQAIKFQTISYGEGVKEKERNAAIAEFRTGSETPTPISSRPHLRSKSAKFSCSRGVAPIPISLPCC